MPLSHAEAVLSLRDDPLLATLSDEDLASEVQALIGDDDPLAIAMIVEEARSLGPAPRQAQPSAAAEPCRLEKQCGGSSPVAANGRCLVCGANRGTAEADERLGQMQRPIPADAEEPSDTEAAEAPPTPAPTRPVIRPAGDPSGIPAGPLTARAKAALGLTDGDMGKILGVSRPTAQAYASGRLPEIIDGVRAEYLKRAVAKRQAALAQLDHELRLIIAASD